MRPDKYTRKFMALIHIMFMEQLHLTEVKRIAVMWGHQKALENVTRVADQDAYREKILSLLINNLVIDEWRQTPSELQHVLEEDLHRLDLAEKVEEFIAGWSTPP